MNKQRIYIRDGRAPIPKTELISKTMSAIKDKNTKPELILRKSMWHRGMKGYRLHWRKVPGRPDIAFPGRRIAIFVNGCFWHRCPHCSPPMPKSHTKFWNNKFNNNVRRDSQKIEALEKMKWDTIVIWECQIKNNLHGCISYVKKVVEKREDSIN